MQLANSVFEFPLATDRSWVALGTASFDWLFSAIAALFSPSPSTGDAGVKATACAPALALLFPTRFTLSLLALLCFFGLPKASSVSSNEN